MHFGYHVSIRQGYLGAAQTAWKSGMSCFQYFPKNPRSLTVKKFDLSEAKQCAMFSRQHQLSSIAHAPYPTNLALDQEDPLIKITIQSILNDLSIAQHCGSIGLVVHFGKTKDREPLQGYKNIINTLNSVLNEWSGEALILLENQAGEGGRLGITMEELLQIRNLAQFPEKIGFCLDTCHAFASGMWGEDDLGSWIEKGNRLEFFQHVRAIHLNDSLFSYQSFRDRHAPLGKGKIKATLFHQLLQLSWIENIPTIIEAPGATIQEDLNWLDKMIMMDSR